MPFYSLLRIDTLFVIVKAKGPKAKKFFYANDKTPVYSVFSTQFEPNIFDGKKIQKVVYIFQNNLILGTQEGRRGGGELPF